MLDQLLSHDGSRSWIVLLVGVLVVVGIFCIIRDCFCWFMRTSKILEQVRIANIKLDAHLDNYTEELNRYKEELQKKIKTLEKTDTLAGDASSGGDAPCQ